jgi:hypothetical protein
MSTLYKSLHHPLSLFPASCVFISRSLAAGSISEDSLASRAQVLSSKPPVQNSTLNCQLTGFPLLSSLQPLCTDRVENIDSNSNSIVVWIFVTAGTFLPIRCISPLFIRQLHNKGYACYSMYYLLKCNVYVLSHMHDLRIQTA